MKNNLKIIHLALILFTLLQFSLGISCSFAEVESSEKCSRIISQVKAYYDRIKSIEAKYTRSIVSQQGSQSVVSRIKYKNPNKIRIDNIEPVEVSYISDGKFAWLYNKKKNQAEKIDIDANIEQIAGIESLLLINPFPAMKTGFTFQRIEDFDNCIIIKATPTNTNGNISMALVKIDPLDKKVLAYELFDKKERLLSQTKYLDCKDKGSGIKYPSTMETTICTDKGEIKSFISFERVFINKDIQDTMFQLPDDKNIKVIEMPETK